MDSVTQIALGGAVGQAVLGRHIGNKAVIWGALAGFIPDLDVVPTQFMDDVNRVVYHRSITHSIPFALALSPLLTAIARKVHPSYRQAAGWWRWSLMFFLGLFTHALLDCFTTWGTQLFWPLEYRVAIQSIFVIDPLYTLPLLVGLIWSTVQNHKRPGNLKANRLGLIISAAYLLLTVANKQWVESQFAASLKKKDIAFTNITTRPTPFNNLLWSANAETTQGFHTGYFSLLDKQWPIGFDYYPKRHALLPDTLRELPKLQKLIGITQQQYIIRKAEGEAFYYLHDLRFGQLAGWLDEQKFPQANKFVFTYRIQPKALKRGQSNGIQRVEPEFEQVSGLLKRFWVRLKGI